VSFDESAREETKRGSRQFSRGKIDELRLNDEKPSFASGRETRVAEFAKFVGFRIGKVGFAKPAFESLPQARNPIVTQLQLPICRREPSRMPWSIFWCDYCVTFDNEWSE